MVRNVRRRECHGGHFAGYFAGMMVAVGLLMTGCSTAPSGGPSLSAPPSTAADNDIYLSDAQGNIRALRPDGTEQWRYALADDLVRQRPEASRDLKVDRLIARSGGKVFGMATELSGRYAGQTILFALDGGHLSWLNEVAYPGPNGAPIAVGNDAVYLSGNDGVLYAFARNDGRALWQYRVGQGPIGAPTVGGDGTIYVTGPRQNLHAVGPNGAPRWVAETQ